MAPSLIVLSAPTKTRSATWDDYLTQLANSEIEDCRVFFSNGSLWIEMGNKGINHARFYDLITFIFGILQLANQYCLKKSDVFICLWRLVQLGMDFLACGL
jgi:hypothetical protein